MSLADKFTKITNLAKAASGKKMSSLSEEQKHAVLFLGNYFPASFVGEQPKYDKAADTYTLSCSYVEARKINKSVSADCKFSSNTFHVYHDEDVTFPIAFSVDQCLKEYPDTLSLPDKKFETSLKPLMKGELEIVNPWTVISSMIMKIFFFITKQENKDMNLVIKDIKDNEEEFRTLAIKLEISEHIIDTILEHTPKSARKPRISIEYKNQKMSFIAAYLYHAYNEVHLVRVVGE